MANVRLYDPFEERFDELVKNFFRPVFWQPTAERQMQVKMDVTENDKAYVIKAELPGVKKEDINVAIDGNQVTISTEVKQEKDVKEGERLLRSERYYGKAHRSFALAQDVDEAAASASYTDGVLELTLPKKTATSAKKLEIR
jgi:HSP20 family protein